MCMIFNFTSSNLKNCLIIRKYNWIENHPNDSRKKYAILIGNIYYT